MRKYAMVMALGLWLAGHPSNGQVEARTATPEELGEETLVKVTSPMLLEIDLGAHGERRSLGDPGVQGRTSYDTKRFVCDKARVPKILVMKRQNKRGGIDLEVTPTLTTEWARQDVDLTVALISGGKEVQTKTWDDLTVGANDSTPNKLSALTPFAGLGGSSTKHPVAVFSFKKGELETLFEQPEAPKLRLIVVIQE